MVESTNGYDDPVAGQLLSWKEMLSQALKNVLMLTSGAGPTSRSKVIDWIDCANSTIILQWTVPGQKAERIGNAYMGRV